MALTTIPSELSSVSGIADSSDATAITIDSSENVTFAGNILKTGDLTVDVSGVINLDAGTQVILKDDGTNYGTFYQTSSDFYIQSLVQDKDIVLYGNDGGSGIIALRIDMSEGGNIGIGGTGNAIDELLHLEKSSGTTMVKTEVASNSVVGFNIKKTGSTTQEWKIVDGQTANGKLEIYDVTDSRSVMTFDGSGNVGIGEVSPDRVFHVKRSDSGGTVAKFENSAGTVYIELNTNNQGGADAGYLSYDSSKNLGFWTDDTQRVTIDSAGTLKVGNPAGVPTPTNGWDANLDAIQVGEASAFRSGDSDYSAATVVSTNIYQTGGGDKLLNGTDYAASYAQQGGNHYFYGYDNGSADATPAVPANDLANPVIIHKGGGISIGGGSVANTANGKAGIFWHGNPQNGGDYCIRRTNDAWSGSNYAQLLIDWDTGVKIDVGNDAYGKSFLEVVGSVYTKSSAAKFNLGNLSASGRWDRSVLANLHPSLAADGTHIGNCNDARNLGIRSLYHVSTSSNRPSTYGIIWANEHYVGDSGKGSAYISQVAVAHSGTPVEYRRNTDTGSGTSFSSWYSVDMTSTSDVREKKNIVDAPAQLNLLKQIKVREFDYINDVEPNKELGMIAQELETILPKYVEKGIDKEGEPDEDIMWRVHYKKMIPMLIKSIQEQQTLIETLQTKVAALEAK